MIFDHKYKKLKRDPKQIIVQEHMSINTLARMKAYKGLSVNERPPVRRLFGHLTRVDYTDPGEGLVRHANSDSDPDNPLHPVDPDAKRKRQVVNVGAKSGKTKKKEIRLEVTTEPENKKSTPRRNKTMAKKGLHIVDEASVDSEETLEDEHWDSETESLKTATPKATEAGVSTSQNVEDQGNKSPIPVDEDEVILNLDEVFTGSPVQADNSKKKKPEKPSIKRKKEIESLIA